MKSFDISKIPTLNCDVAAAGSYQRTTSMDPRLVIGLVMVVIAVP